MRAPRNFNWNVERDTSGHYSWEGIHAALLMDIRAELQTLNGVFRCHNALAIPDLLRTIKKNTTKRKYVRKAK